MNTRNDEEDLDDEAESLLFNLVYCSRAAAGLDSAEISRIVDAARIANAKAQVTGWLVHGSGIFFQWLEGPRDNVQRLMTAINADTRHNTVVILSEAEEFRERLFPDWDMEPVSREDIRAVLFDAMSAAPAAHHREGLRVLINELDAKGI